MTNNFKGTGVALITPFHDYGTIDFSAFERIIEHVVSKGINYIVALGTTGESVTLSKDEKLAILDFVIETVNKRVPIVAGVGGNNTQEVINTIKSTSFEGIDAILSVCPYYNKPQQQGIYNHYKAIAGASPVPVILYNVPGRTSSNISAETTLALASDFGNIIGIKEASGNLVQIMEIMKNKPRSFLVISGDDQLTFPLCTLGASGVISVVANAFPAEFTEMVSLAKKGKLKKSRTIHYGLLEIMNALFEDGSPAGIKAALEIMGLCSSTLRLPLVQVSPKTYTKLEKLIHEFRPILQTAK
jgi:4-hydroxy-tetrahydrodipicolinate synthase